MAPAGKLGLGNGKGKILKILIFSFFFQQSRVAGSGLALAGKPGVGKGKSKILKLLISCFLFSRETGDGPWER